MNNQKKKEKKTALPVLKLGVHVYIHVICTCINANSGASPTFVDLKPL